MAVMAVMAVLSLVFGAWVDVFVTRRDKTWAPHVLWGSVANSLSEGGGAQRSPTTLPQSHLFLSFLSRRPGCPSLADGKASYIMSQTPDRIDPSNLFDPFGFWKQTQQTVLDSWSKTMTEAVNTDAYSEATGRLLDTYLTVSAPMRKIIEQTMTQLLNQLNLPSRAEVVSLAGRMTNIEFRLDDLDVRLAEIERVTQRIASSIAALSVLTTLNTQTTPQVVGAASAANGATREAPAATNRANRANKANGATATATTKPTPRRRRTARSDGPTPENAPARATRTARTTRGTRVAQATGAE